MSDSIPWQLSSPDILRHTSGEDPSPCWRCSSRPSHCPPPSQAMVLEPPTRVPRCPPLPQAKALEPERPAPRSAADSKSPGRATCSSAMPSSRTSTETATPGRSRSCGRYWTPITRRQCRGTDHEPDREVLSKTAMELQRPPLRRSRPRQRRFQGDLNLNRITAPGIAVRRRTSLIRLQYG